MIGITRVALLALAAILTLPCGIAVAEFVPFDPAKRSFPITVDAAKQSVRAWARDASLKLVLESAEVGPDFCGVEHARYLIDTTDASQRFEVDCASGEITRWVDRTALKACEARARREGPSDMLPLEDLRASAQAFAAARCPGFAGKKMAAWEIDDAVFLFFQRLTNGVWYDRNSVSVEVDDWTGRAYSYSMHTCPVPTISMDYTVTKDAAESAAIGHVLGLIDKKGRCAQSVFVWKNRGVWLITDSHGSHRLAYRVDVVASTKPNYTLAAYGQQIHDSHLEDLELPMAVSIDAVSGAVVSCEAASGIMTGPQSVAPPIFSPSAGAYPSGQLLTIRSIVGSTVRYTTDGSTPTKSSKIYTSPIALNHSLTLKARAWKPNRRSSVVTSASYTIR